MNWNHVVLEAYCLFSEEDKEIPTCCIYEPGRIGIHCFEYDEKIHNHCPFLALGKARSTLLLINETGDVIVSKAYKGDDSLIDENLWLNAERGWIKKWKERLLNRKKD